MSICELPDDIFWHLLPHLNIEDKISLSQVNGRMKSIIVNCSRFFNFECQYSVDVHKAVECLTSNPKQVLEISLNHVTWLDQNLMTRAIQKCSNLQALHLIGFNISSRNICKILKNLSHLHTFSFEPNSPIPLSYITNQIEKVFFNLKKYTLSLCAPCSTTLKVNLKCDLYGMLSYCHSLDHLSISIDPILSKAIFPVNCTSIQTLQLNSDNKNILNFLKECNLEEIISKFHKLLHDNKKTELWEVKVEKKCVVLLHLSVTQLNPNGLAGSFPHLTDLQLTGTLLLDEKQESLKFPNLISLQFSMDYLPSEIWQVLDCPKLQNLYIYKDLYFKNEELINFLIKYIKGLKHLILPTIYNKVFLPRQPTNESKRPRLSHMKEMKNMVIDHICTHNPFLCRLSLSQALTPFYMKSYQVVQFSESSMSALERLHYLTRFDISANPLMTGKFLESISQHCVFLKELLISALEPSFIRCIFNALPHMPCLTRLELEAEVMLLPHKTKLSEASNLQRAVFSYKTSNLFNLHSTPLQILEGHPSLYILLFVCKELKEQTVISSIKPSARFICRRKINSDEEDLNYI